jgi:hypothetical protein
MSGGVTGQEEGGRRGVHQGVFRETLSRRDARARRRGHMVDGAEDGCDGEGGCT